MNKTQLMEAVKTSPNTMAKMGKNENVSMEVITRICDYLRCDVGDIMEMIDENGENE